MICRMSSGSPRIWISTLAAIVIAIDAHAQSELAWIGVAADGSGFVIGDEEERFTPWGVNYDHDGDNRLIEDYWDAEWDTVVEDFGEIRDLGANVVRIHLQLGKFMSAPDEPNAKSLAKLNDLLKLAEKTGLYLDITGLGCYHKQDIPEWYDKLPEAERWTVQARFWEAVATTCAASPAVFCYDLMNEPIVPGGKKVETDWLGGEFAGKYFVQRIALDLAGRTRAEVVKAWIEKLTTAIRKHDQRHLITVGVIPWSHVWPKAKPVFYAPEVSKPLDFVSVHLYPKDGVVEKAMAALSVYDLGKPLVIEEIFPLKSNIDQTAAFIEASKKHADGWISFYWGTTIADYEAKKKPTLAEAITRDWLKRFRDLSPARGGG